MRISDFWALQTLHSNLVIFQLRVHHQSARVQETLHSNLVIFQYIRAFILTTLCTFTFQSGHIPIFYSIRSTCSNLRFTFQSGHIPIQSGHMTLHILLLYIPIWSYSNIDLPFFFIVFPFFTFQSGHIPILLL